MARGAELPVLALRAHALEEIHEKALPSSSLWEYAKPFTLAEEEREDAAIAELEEGVAEDVAEQTGQVRGLLRGAQRLDALGEKRDAPLGGDGLGEEIAPALLGERAGEEAALAAHADGFLAEVVHEFVVEAEGDEFDLVGGQRELADEDVAAGVNAAFGVGDEPRRRRGYPPRAEVAMRISPLPRSLPRQANLCTGKKWSG